MSNDNTRDAAEPSLASAGSHGEPVAWAVLPPALPGVKYRVTFDRDEAERIACGAMTIVPLYEKPQPTLTDAEREAVGRAAMLIDDSDLALNDYRALRGLYERTQ